MKPQLIGTVLAVAAAIVVTGQAMSAPPRPYKARDIIAANQPALAEACVMYPAECRFNGDGSVARVLGRRIVPNSHGAVLGHFRTSVGAVDEPGWAPLTSNNTND